MGQKSHEFSINLNLVSFKSLIPGDNTIVFLNYEYFQRVITWLVIISIGKDCSTITIAVVKSFLVVLRGFETKHLLFKASFKLSDDILNRMKLWYFHLLL